MSFVAPYGDLTSRGKFNSAVTFRRKGDNVIMYSTPSKKPTRTPGQAAQRNRFLSASNAWKLLFYETREFFNDRAKLISKAGRPVYIGAYLKDQLPSIVPGIPIKTIDSMFLHNPSGTLPDNFKITISSLLTTPEEIGCFLWSKVDDLPSTLNPEVGPAGSQYGTLNFTAGKWNGAITNNGEAALGIWPIGTKNLNQLILGVWWKPHYSSNSSHPSMDIIYASGNADHYFRFYVTASNDAQWPNKFGLTLEFDEGNKGISYYFNHSGFTAGQWYHLLFCFNNLWGDGARYQFYIADAPQSIYQVFQEDPEDVVDSWSFRLPGAFHAYADLDNPKAYNNIIYLPEVIDNINNEGFDQFPFPSIVNGSVEDNSNIFTAGQPGSGTPPQTVTIEETAGVGCTIPFYYPVWVKWTDHDDNVSDDIMRLPEINLGPNEVLTLYLSKDFSTYYDPNFHRLACTGKEFV